MSTDLSPPTLDPADPAAAPPSSASQTSSATESSPTGERSPIAGPSSALESSPIAEPSLAAASVVDVRELDWAAIRRALDPAALRARMRAAVESMETLLDRAAGPGLMFDADRANAADRVPRISALDETSPLWIIGDLHGDWLALEAALSLIRQHAAEAASGRPRIIFLGDFFDDEGFGIELLVRLFELVSEAPERVCIVCGNHDEALAYDGSRFVSTVSPGDFAEFLNAHLSHEWIVRAGKLAVRLTARAPRALFFPDGLLVAHGGFPLVDLHAELEKTGDWNAPACLTDFVWARMHPKARRKLPNRFSRGSQFGYEDFADFCALSSRLGRPVTHFVRGHDHVEERYAIAPAYQAHPVLTTVALSRRLPREHFGSYERAATLARVITGSLPQVYRLCIPASVVRDVYPEPEAESDADERESAPA